MNVLSWILITVVLLIGYVAIGVLLTVVLYRSRRGRKILLDGAKPDRADVTAGVFLWPLMLIIGAVFWAMSAVERRIDEEREHGRWTR